MPTRCSSLRFFLLVLIFSIETEGSRRKEMTKLNCVYSIAIVFIFYFSNEVMEIHGYLEWSTFFFGLADQTCWSSRARIKRQKRGELPYVYLMMLWSTAVKRPLSKHLHISVLLKMLLAVGSMYLFNLFEQILWYVPSFPIGSLQWWEFRCSSGLPRWLELCHCVVKLIMGLI